MKIKLHHIAAIFTLLLSLLVLLGDSRSAYAAAPEPEQMAASLKELGLFLGTNNGFELDKPCDRPQGAVILTRLLGREQEALAGTWQHPFADITGSYAEPYIGYLYQQGLINGVSATAYGTAEMTAAQFAALVLRALGYQDVLDFTWQTSLSTMAGLGLLSGTEAASLGSEQFLRGQAVLLCHRALQSTTKGMEQPLIHRLLWNEVFTTQQLAKSGDAALMLAADMPDYMGFVITAYSEQEFRDIIWLALKNRQSNLSLRVPGLSWIRARAALIDMHSAYFPRDIMIEMSQGDDGVYHIFALAGDYMALQFYYESPERYAKNFQFYESSYLNTISDYISLSMWRDKIDALVAEHTEPGMSEYEQVKALHDYLALNITYDKEAGEDSISHLASGVLFNGAGVCDGFAAAFKMLCEGAGIESRVIYGSTREGEHAWNQVKIDGEWYNADVTWAATGSADGIFYGYFCAPDSIFGRDHISEKPALTQSCTSTRYYNPGGNL